MSREEKELRSEIRKVVRKSTLDRCEMFRVFFEEAGTEVSRFFNNDEKTIGFIQSFCESYICILKELKKIL